jgi:hypothetical protein
MPGRDPAVEGPLEFNRGRRATRTWSVPPSAQHTFQRTLTAGESTHSSSASTTAGSLAALTANRECASSGEGARLAR